MKVKKDKTIKLTPFIGDNDLERKIKQGVSFVEKGHRVKFQMDVHGKGKPDSS